MDVVFVSLAFALAALSLGLIAICNALMGGQS